MTNTQDTTALVERLREHMARVAAKRPMPLGANSYQDRADEIAWDEANRGLRLAAAEALPALLDTIAALSAPQQPLGDVEAMREAARDLRTLLSVKGIKLTDDARTAINHAFLALATPVAEQPPSFTPDDVVLVPRDPTDAMLSALEGVDYTNESERAIGCNLWYTMLNAAPKAQPSDQIVALTAENTRLRERVTELEDGVVDIADHAEARIQSGDENDAYVWRNALDDTIRDARALIQTKDNDDALPE